jgi:hypothetical protein
VLERRKRQGVFDLPYRLDRAPAEAFTERGTLAPLAERSVDPGNRRAIQSETFEK